MTWTLGCTTRPFAPAPFAEACQRIAAAGYTDVGVFAGVVAPDSPPEAVRAARETALAAGLEPSPLLAHARLELGLEAAVADYRRLMDNAALLGARWLLDLGASQESAYELYVALMRQVAPAAQEAGLGIAVKPHGGITLTTQGLIALHRAVDRPAFGICFDPGNIIYYTVGEQRPETEIADVAPLVTVGIIKDCLVRDGQPDVMITPGEGWVDFQAVLGGLAAGGFDGPLYVECVGGSEPAEIDRNVARTRGFVEGILAGL